MVRWVSRLAVIVTAILGFAVVLFGAFVAWRIPNEREEERLFTAHVQRDDGPHLTWLDDRRVRISTFRFDHGRQEYVRHDLTSPCETAGRAATLLDPNAWVECSSPPAAPVAETSAPVVAALSDVHGHYRHLAALLQRAGVVDGRLDWSFGVNHLVVAGDVLDKGPEITRSLWFVRKLERQAAAVGGRVHYLLGNHEYLALTGASRINDRKYIELTTSLGIAYADLFSPTTELGRFIRQHGVAVRINDTLFVHAGFAPAVVNSGVSLEALNRIARETIVTRPAGAMDDRAKLVWGPDGVTSYRRYFDRSFPLGFWRALHGDLREGRGAEASVAGALARYGARRLVVGHTEVREITPLLGDRLVAVCQRMPSTDLVDENSRAELLLIEGPHLSRIGLDGRRRPL